MKIAKTHLALIFTFALGVSMAIPAHAGEEKQTTAFTFSAPVEIPGEALPAGTYIFERYDADNSDLVQIYNADHTQLLATLETVPVSRMEVSGDPAITVAQEENGNPDVLVRWFYRDSLTGHEFVYSGQQKAELTQGKQETFVGDHLANAGQAAGE